MAGFSERPGGHPAHPERQIVQIMIRAVLPDYHFDIKVETKFVGAEVHHPHDIRDHSEVVPLRCLPVS